jgi:peptidyl-tRNA hydrolase
MANIRHTVVVRRDLQLSPGLLAAQVAHISDSFMRNKLMDSEGFFEKEETEWMKAPYISVLAVDTREELEAIRNHAQENGLPVYEWTDVIPSKALQKPIKSFVGISIGPDDFDLIKLVTGTLELY